VSGPGKAASEAPATGGASGPLGEARWPIVTAVVAYMALNIGVRLWLPTEAAVRVPWLLPALEVVLIAVLLASGSRTFVREALWLRRGSLALALIFVVSALWATFLLVYDLVKGIGVTNSPGRLLATGALVWIGSNLAFALLYWLIDSGGPRARARHRRIDFSPIDFAFPQHMNPELAPSGWRPVFLDYLHLGFTNATAFSPTDVMPLSHRAKYTMMIQATVALALFGLIVARAVNAFS